MSPNRLRILCVLGTRPEAVKMAPVIQRLGQCQEECITQVCVTAQHRQMLDQVLALFGIVPDIDLDLMHDDQTLSGLAARVLHRMDGVLQDTQPDWMLVQGDTTTVMMAAVAAYHRRVKIGHVEAGLRSHDRGNPFPEEMNRVIADVLSDLHFAPTERARTNLLSMGVPDGSIRVTGNTVVDALLDVSSRLPAHAPSGWPEIPGDKRLILVTAHRRESFGRPLENICMALREIAAACRPELHIVYPVHLNPNVQEPVHRLLGRDPSISLLPPLDYVSLIWLMKHCYVVLTDSGGIQEEAPSLGKPVLILRDVTERPEAIEAGTARLVGTDVGSIVAETLRLVRDRRAYESMARVTNPFGDGHAAERIVAALLPGQNREPS